jgi:hypothetical protein
MDAANDMQVHVSTQERTDTEIAQAVRHALESDVVVPDTQIRSTVSHGWVTLEGEVGVCHERDAAERAISKLASGARCGQSDRGLPAVRQGRDSPGRNRAGAGAARGSSRRWSGARIGARGTSRSLSGREQSSCVARCSRRPSARRCSGRLGTRGALESSRTICVRAVCMKRHAGRER